MALNRHGYMLCFSAWGHARPMLGFATKLLNSNPGLVMTIFLPNVIAVQAVGELARYRYDRDRLRILHFQEGVAQTVADVGALTKDEGGVMKWMDNVKKTFEKAYEALLTTGECLNTLSGQFERTFPLPPNFIVLEMIFADLNVFVSELHARLGFENVKIYRSDVGSAAHILKFGFMDPFPGGQASYVMRVRNVLKAVDSGEDRDAAWNKWVANNEDLTDVPLIGPKFFYEFEPHQPDPAIYWTSLPGILQRDKQLDGILGFWPACISESATRISQENGYSMSFVGAQIPPPQAQPVVLAAEKSPGFDFLDQALKEEGKHSVLYMAFGTMFFTPTAAQLKSLLEVCLRLKQRLLVARGSLDDEVVAIYDDAVARSAGRILVVGWVDQYAILQHEAVGTFLNHAGTGGVLESLHAGVPMILWPHSGDHVSTAASMCVEKVAVELLQVRTGYNVGRKTAARGVMVEGTPEAIEREFEEVLTGMRGSLGEELRANARKLAIRLAEDAESGPSYEAIRRIALG